MPRLSEERWNEIVRLVGSQAVRIDEVWEQLDVEERSELIVRAHAYAEEQAKRHVDQYFGPPQKAARRLLRALLTDEQCRELRHSYGFKVRGSGGGVYKLWPWTGLIVRVEERRGRWYEVERYCYHEEDPFMLMPPADRAIAQLCLLRHDEDAFLAAANASPAHRPRRWAA
jgi:hypothetical protein